MTGDIVDSNNQVVGHHSGHQHFTIGQRRGVGVALGYPIYVTDRDPKANTITIGQSEDLMSSSLTADQTNWLVDPPLSPGRCQVKIRYNSQPVPATVTAHDDQLQVTFDQPQSAVTPGQAVVCYDDQQVLGGGWINSAPRTG